MNSSISTDVANLICQLTRPDNGCVIIQSMQMQKQTERSTCGVYAIAVATALCNGEDPSEIQWKQSLM